MKTLILIFISLTAYANTNLVDCAFKINLSTIEQLQKKVHIDEKVTFFNYEEFKITVLRKTTTKIEIEVYNANEPSRSYATGNLFDREDVVELAIWKRDLLLEVNCRTSL